MIFNSLTLTQNILFIIACIGLLLILAYLILLFSGYIRAKKKIQSDDIDDTTDDYETTSFFCNAFGVRGGIFFFGITATITFVLSLFVTLWLAILIASIIATGVVILISLLDRSPIANRGELAIVTQTIPEKNSGFGKVLLIETNCEVDAETKNGAIKKGKKVVVLENNFNKVLVQKIKK